MHRASTLAMVLVLGCRAPEHPSERPPEQPRPAPPRPTEVIVASQPRVASAVVGIEPDGGLDVLFGPRRAIVRGEAFVWAADVMATAIVGATRMEGGWLYIASDSLVAQSDEFLGELRRVGDVPRRVRRVTPSRGRLAVIDERDELWTTDGASPIERAPLPGEVLAAVFADARRGAAIIDGGALLRTDDGGAHWAPVDLHGDGASQVWQYDGDRVAVISAEARSLDRGARAWLMPPPLHLDQAQRSALRHLAGGWPDIDLQRAYAAGRALVLPSAYRLTVDGSIEEEPHADVVLPSGTAYRLASDGSILRARNGGPFEPLAARRVLGLGRATALHEGIVFSDDGEHLAWLGACDQPPVKPIPTTPFLGLGSRVCVVSGARDPGRTRVAAAAVEALLSMHGDLLIFLTPDGDINGLHADTGDPFAADPSLRHVPGRRILAASIMPDETLVIVSERAGKAELETWRLGAPGPTRVVLPPGTRAAAFADAQRGLAAGATLGEIQRTLDGGASWSRPPLPPDADTSTPLGKTVQCEASGCLVGNLVTLRGWGPWHASGKPPLAAQTGLPLAHPQGPWPSSLVYPFSPVLAAIKCDGPHRGEHFRTWPSPGAKPEPRDQAPGRAPPPPGAPQRTAELAAAGAVALLTESRTATGRTLLQVSWRGADARGAFSVQAPAVPAPDPLPLGYVLLAATRRGLLLESCPPPPFGGQGCALVWADARGALRALPDPVSACEVRDRQCLLGALALPDGGAMIVLSADQRSGEVPEPVVVDRVIRLAPDGAVAAQRSFALISTLSHTETDNDRRTAFWSRLHTLAVFRSTAGLAVGDRHDPSRLRFYPLERDMAAGPENLPPLRLGSAGACADAADPNTAMLAMPAGASVLVPGIASRVRAMIEVSARGTCIRAVDAWAPAGWAPDWWSGNGLDLRASEGRSLSGTAGGWTGRTPLRCSVGEPPRGRLPPTGG